MRRAQLGGFSLASADVHKMRDQVLHVIETSSHLLSITALQETYKVGEVAFETLSAFQALEKLGEKFHVKVLESKSSSLKFGLYHYKMHNGGNDIRGFIVADGEVLRWSLPFSEWKDVALLFDREAIDSTIDLSNRPEFSKLLQTLQANANNLRSNLEHHFPPFAELDSRP